MGATAMSTARCDGELRWKTCIAAGGNCFFFLLFLSFIKGLEPGSIRERRGIVLAARDHAGVDRPHGQGGHQHGPAGRGAGRARQR